MLFDLSSANALEVDKSKMLSYGTDLKLFCGERGIILVVMTRTNLLKHLEKYSDYSNS